MHKEKQTWTREDGYGCRQKLRPGNQDKNYKIWELTTENIDSLIEATNFSLINWKWRDYIRIKTWIWRY